MTTPLVFIIAGEPSGDMLGARLMAGLKAETGGRIRFAGVGGEAMAAEGLDSLFDMGDLAVMGFLEVLPRIPRILRRERETVAEIRRLRPDALVTIDSWGFTGRINRAIRKGGPRTPQIHYVAPMVWAWREQRAARMAPVLDHLMTLLPFEPPYFEAVGLPTTHVGHPVIESGAERGRGASFRERNGIPETAPLLCLLPGSRRGEIARLLPRFEKAVSLLAARHPSLELVAPTVATVADRVAAATSRWAVPVRVVRGQEDKYDAFAAADVALAASGTVALELAMAGTPAVVTYRLSALTVWMFRRMTRIRYVNLVNHMLDRLVVPELLQENCRAELLAEEVARLLDDPTAREEQRIGLREAMVALGLGGPSPSTRAARVVLSVMEQLKGTT
ncbi:MAG: lipid-A-disaccharide synthase [Alphaproteobacteria bacterium]|nr:lipid-A-disaccharide synthase [Alphaproteobacteria bacterium]